MTVSLGLIYDKIRPEERMLIESARSKGIPLKLYDAEHNYFRLTGDGGEDFEQVILQRCMSYFRALHLTAFLEGRGVNVVNSFQAAVICGNKALTSITLAKAGIPIPRTMLAFTEEAALSALDELGYPAILKPVIGSWGRLIAPLKDPDSARAFIENREYMFPIYQVYYLQEMIEKPDRDIRCFVIGDRAVAAIYRYPAPGEWKTNVARGGRAEPCKVTGELEEVAVKAAETVGGGVFGVDLMESDRGLLVHEINYTTEFKTTVNATGIDIPGLIVEYALNLAKG
ncbi:MAG: lysine biosynthesis protein LysX [Candidatus Bathyarchaeia archaeon]